MQRVRRVLQPCAGAALGTLFGLLLRLCLFVTGALAVRSLGHAWQTLGLPPAWFDPVYSHAAQRSLSDLRVQGLAVGGPIGAWLHASVPDLFVDPSRARWALVRVVVEPGSPVLARLLAAAIAHAGVLAVGLLLVRHGARRRVTALWVAGVAMQVQVALAILGAQPSARELEATGASFALNALAPWLNAGGSALTDGLTPLWPPLVAGCLVALALLVAYSPTGLFLLLRGRLRSVTLGTASVIVLTSATCAGIMIHNTDTPAAAAPGAVMRDLPVNAHLVGERWFDSPTPDSQRPVAPSHVEVVAANNRYEYRVNGQLEVIKGMGLNTQYSSQLTPTERAEQLRSDMAALHALGVNTVLGWDPAEFDGALLDAAQRESIGVVMPFDLDPSADYADPTVRQTLHDAVLTWVQRYRNHPALRMWGLGNEVLHKIVHPAWVGPQDPDRQRRAEAFSDWLVETADAIHTLDPDHPVTYRSAEDAFVPWVAAALNRRGGGARPWFVWGTNCYQSYLGDILNNWPTSGLPTALWVSEFAPGGIAVPERPDGFASMWSLIRRNPEWVLGGAVYAWTRNGPEGVDRNFGLTDDGQPVDGRSLDMLASLFHTE